MKLVKLILITLLFVSSLVIDPIQAVQDEKVNDEDVRCQKDDCSDLLTTTKATPTQQSTTISSTTTTTTTTTATPTTTTTSSTTTTSASTSTSAAAKARKLPPTCSLSGQKITCNGVSPASLKDALKANPEITEVYLRNLTNSTFVLSAHLTGQVELLDLSNNNIRTLVATPQGAKKQQVKEADGIKLKTLILNNNRLENLTGHFSTIRLPLLDVLDLSSNPVMKLEANDFNNTRNVTKLQLDHLKQLKTIDETTLSPLVNLKRLSFRNGSSIIQDLSSMNDLFTKNWQLKWVDLSDNQLIEVPNSLRRLRSLVELNLNGNYMTSLRPSDFSRLNNLTTLRISQCPNLTKVDEFTFGELLQLKELYLSNNPAFSHFSSDAFKRQQPQPQPQAEQQQQQQQQQQQHSLTILDLSYNNLSQLAKPTLWPAVTIQADGLLLEGNPWDCQCGLQWLLEVRGKSELHCRTPANYRDMNVRVYFETTDCQVEESSLQKTLLVLFLLFLVALTVGVFVQKSDICRRLHWRDQYGTIYYTKASFPPANEQV